MAATQISNSNSKNSKKLCSSTTTSTSSDTPSILLLLLLYLLQGIPLGLISAIPMILQNHHISYTEQAKFSFSYWPFSLKLLWAPIVDSVFSERMGRRKTWLIPMQYGIGIFMFVLSGSVDQLIEIGNVNLLTFIFFMLNFLAATQDIAVDGWALTMLKRENVGYASTCNSVGQTAGYFLGYVVFLALESTDFCNQYLRSVPEQTGLVTLPGFLQFWSWVFIVTTTVVWIFKSEDPEVENNEISPRNKNHNNNFQKHYQSVITNYKGLWKIFQLSNIKLIIAVLLTVKIGFAVDSVTGLKLVEAGVPKDRLALLAIPMTPLQILLPFLISKYTAGPRPMDVFLLAMPIRLLFGFVFASIVYITPSFQLADGSYPYSYYIMIVVAYSFHQVTLYSMFVAVMSFFAIVSDPLVGGTYMTLLNTVSNLGGNWPSTVALWGVDKLTWKMCEGIPNNTCGDSATEQICIANGSKCITSLDGYYVETIICVVFGFLWLFWGRPVIRKLQRRPLSTWKVQEANSIKTKKGD